MIKVTDVRKGNILMYEGDPWIVHETLHRTPGNLSGFVRLKMRNLKTGSMIDQRFTSDAKLELAFVETRKAQYSYFEGGNYVFLEAETYEQIPIAKDKLPEDVRLWLIEGLEVSVIFFDGQATSIELPNSVELMVKETEPTVKGGTVAPSFKSAVLENGATVKVPPFIENGDKVRVNPQTGEFLERVSK